MKEKVFSKVRHITIRVIIPVILLLLIWKCYPSHKITGKYINFGITGFSTICLSKDSSFTYKSMNFDGFQFESQGRYIINQNNVVFRSAIQPVWDSVRVKELFIDSIKDKIVFVIKNQYGDLEYNWFLIVNNDSLNYIDVIDGRAVIKKEQFKTINAQKNSSGNTLFVPDSLVIDSYILFSLGTFYSIKFDNKAANFIELDIYEPAADTIKDYYRFFSDDAWHLKGNKLIDLKYDEKYTRWKLRKDNHGWSGSKYGCSEESEK
jgi:hypothetical protein